MSFFGFPFSLIRLARLQKKKLLHFKTHTIFPFSPQQPYTYAIYTRIHTYTAYPSLISLFFVSFLKIDELCLPVWSGLLFLRLIENQVTMMMVGGWKSDSYLCADLMTTRMKYFIPSESNTLPSHLYNLQNELVFTFKELNSSLELINCICSILISGSSVEKRSLQICLDPSCNHATANVSELAGRAEFMPNKNM